MNIAIPQWQGRVSPVFDVAARLLVVEVGSGQAVSRKEESLKACQPLGRAREVCGLGADVLICGAISWPLEAALVSAGVRVISHACGGVDEVLAAFLDGQLEQDGFLMPGCRSRRGRSWSGGNGRKPGPAMKRRRARAGGDDGATERSGKTRT